jgi:hypothetical protein
MSEGSSQPAKFVKVELLTAVAIGNAAVARSIAAIARGPLAVLSTPINRRMPSAGGSRSRRKVSFR